MPIKKLILSYFFTTIVFFAIDFFWLGMVAKGIYDSLLGNLLAENVNWTAATVFYLIFIVGIFIYAILPGVKKDSAKEALVKGGMFGFFTYTTFELTSLATLRDWPFELVFIDIAWGIFLTSSVAFAGYHITKRLS